MIIAKVTYTVDPSFVQKNQENINKFISDFKQMHATNFLYTSYLCEDGKTFVHISHYENEEIQKRVLQTPSFLSFQKQRDDSGLESSPHIEIIQLVASSQNLLTDQN